MASGHHGYVRLDRCGEGQSPMRIWQPRRRHVSGDHAQTECVDIRRGSHTHEIQVNRCRLRLALSRRVCWGLHMLNRDSDNPEGRLSRRKALLSCEIYIFRNPLLTETP